MGARMCYEVHGAARAGTGIPHHGSVSRQQVAGAAHAGTWGPGGARFRPHRYRLASAEDLSIVVYFGGASVGWLIIVITTTRVAVVIASSTRTRVFWWSGGGGARHAGDPPCHCLYC